MRTRRCQRRCTEEHPAQNPVCNIFHELAPKKEETAWCYITRCSPDPQRFVAQALHEPKLEVPYLHALHGVFFLHKSSRSSFKHFYNLGICKILQHRVAQITRHCVRKLLLFLCSKLGTCSFPMITFSFCIRRIYKPSTSNDSSLDAKIPFRCLDPVTSFPLLFLFLDWINKVYKAIPCAEGTLLIPSTG